jgi:hypothetical protein
MIISYKKPIRKSKPNTSPLEEVDQKECVKYLEKLQKQGVKILFSATAQSTFTKSFGIMAKNKALGVRRGVPDLLIIINDTLVFVELKRRTGGTVSQEQKDWNKALNDAGEYAYICKGSDKFKTLIQKMLEITKEN